MKATLAGNSELSWKEWDSLILEDYIGNAPYCIYQENHWKLVQVVAIESLEEAVRVLENWTSHQNIGNEPYTTLAVVKDWQLYPIPLMPRYYPFGLVLNAWHFWLMPRDDLLWLMPSDWWISFNAWKGGTDPEHYWSLDATRKRAEAITWTENSTSIKEIVARAQWMTRDLLLGQARKHFGIVTDSPIGQMGEL